MSFTNTPHVISTENTTSCALRQRYLQRFVATFISENRHSKMSDRIDFQKASSLIISVVYLKSGYKLELNDVYKVFKDLRYTINGASRYPETAVSLNSKIYLNLDLVQIENFGKLQKYLSGHATKCDRRVQELNLQLDIFNKIYHLKTVQPENAILS